jgi:hypothetical protein
MNDWIIVLGLWYDRKSWQEYVVNQICSPHGLELEEKRLGSCNALKMMYPITYTPATIPHFLKHPLPPS